MKTGGKEEQELFYQVFTEDEVIEIEWRTLLNLLDKDKLADYHISIGE